MKRLFAIALSLMLVAAVSASAMARVERNQINYIDYTLTVNGSFVHHFSLELACGDVTGTGNVGSTAEAISGTYGGGNISFRSYYDRADNYWWEGTFPIEGGNATNVDTSQGQTNLTVVVVKGTQTASEYANHGEWVVENGGGDDAAHSCVGMPVVAS